MSLWSPPQPLPGAFPGLWTPPAHPAATTPARWLPPRNCALSGERKRALACGVPCTCHRTAWQARPAATHPASCATLVPCSPAGSWCASEVPTACLAGNANPIVGATADTACVACTVTFALSNTYASQGSSHCLTADDGERERGHRGAWPAPTTLSAGRFRPAGPSPQATPWAAVCGFA